MMEIDNGMIRYSKHGKRLRWPKRPVRANVCLRCGHETYFKTLRCIICNAEMG